MSIQIQLGPEAFRFTCFAQWVNKAQGWFAARIPPESRGRYLAIDAVGRVCLIGRDFMRARDEGTFPIGVYLIDSEEPSSPTHPSSSDCKQENTDVR